MSSNRIIENTTKAIEESKNIVETFEFVRTSENLNDVDFIRNRIIDDIKIAREVLEIFIMKQNREIKLDNNNHFLQDIRVSRRQEYLVSRRREFAQKSRLATVKESIKIESSIEWLLCIYNNNVDSIRSNLSFFANLCDESKDVSIDFILDEMKEEGIKELLRSGIRMDKKMFEKLASRKFIFTALDKFDLSSFDIPETDRSILPAIFETTFFYYEHQGPFKTFEFDEEFLPNAFKMLGRNAILTAKRLGYQIPASIFEKLSIENRLCYLELFITQYPEDYCSIYSSFEYSYISENVNFYLVRILGYSYLFAKAMSRKNN